MAAALKISNSIKNLLEKVFLDGESVHRDEDQIWRLRIQSHPLIYVQPFLSGSFIYSSDPCD
jgi:hypothetical protein